MATLSTNPNTTDAADRGVLARFFDGVRRGFTRYVEAKGRTEEIERLNDMSDAQLARMGLTRADIPRYVFRDVMVF